MNNNYTLLDILTNNIIVYKEESKESLQIENGIEIPMIQRDYAQGRSDDKTAYIRGKFLNDLYNVMLVNQNGKESFLNLDFVYGYIENSTFIPIDGQQRLTTLYIIYWFLAFKDGVDINENGLHLFTYKTRQSAKEFLKSINTKENLIKIKNELNEDDSLVSVIKNQPWFNINWCLDPTVSGILQTLDEVSLLFVDISFSSLKENRPINFHFLQIDDFGLSDNLYIKMNARGKPLSDFENFKASFENVISSNPNAKYFVNNIDGDWLDGFWKFTLDSDNNSDVEKDVSKYTKRCDEIMFSFIKKITEFLYYKDNIGRNYHFTDVNIETIYSKEDNLHILNESINLILGLNFNKWEEYFINIFSEKFYPGKISINQHSLNFVFKIIKAESFSHFENILFFGWLSYISRTNSSEITNDMKDYLRIIRNFINNINQKNKTSLDSELRTDYYNDIIKSIYTLSTHGLYENLDSNSFIFRKEYIQFEKDKYELFKDDLLLKNLIFKFEDHSTLRGLIFNFDFTRFNHNEINNIVDNFYSLYKEVDYKDIVRLLLCFGDYSIKVGYSNLGYFKFLGRKDKWHRVLASPDGEIKQNFVELFKLFSIKIISDWSLFIENQIVENLNNERKDWLWYALNPKYRDILHHTIFTKSDSGKIELFYNQSLNSYHYNPFVYWFRYYSSESIREYINLADSCAIYSTYSKLHLKNGIELEQCDDKWLIYNLKNNSKDLNLEFNEDQNCFILKCKNLIEDLISMIGVLNNQKIISY